MKYLRRILKLFTRTSHFCVYNKPIVSKYVSFNTRDIIFECRCGKRTKKRIYKTFDEPFPIETSCLISDTKFNSFLNVKKTNS